MISPNSSFPSGSVGKASACDAGKIPWRREWQPTPVFLPGEFHGQRIWAGYSPWGHTRVRQNLVTKKHDHQNFIPLSPHSFSTLQITLSEVVLFIPTTHPCFAPPVVIHCSVAQVCPTLRPHGLQHTRLPCPLPSPRACSNSCPLSRWCHPIIPSSVIPFSSCPQSFPDWKAGKANEGSPIWSEKGKWMEWSSHLNCYSSSVFWSERWYLWGSNNDTCI